MGNWIIYFEIAAIVIVGIIFVLFNTSRVLYTKSSKIFNRILYTVMALGITDILSVYGLSHPGTVSVSANYVILIIYNLSLLGSVYLYAYYVIYMTRDWVRYTYKGFSIIVIPLIIESLLTISAPLNGFVFSVDRNGIYHRGPGMTQFMTVMALYAVFVGYECFARSRYMTKLQQVSIVLFTSVVLAGEIVVAFIPNLLIIAFLLALGALAVYISLQGEYVDSDRMLGTFSAEALEDKVKTYVGSGKSIRLIIVRIGDYDRLNTLVGYEGSNEVLRHIAEYLLKLIPGHQVYHLNCLYFGCLVEGSLEDAHRYAELIEDRLSLNFKIDGYMGSIRVAFGIAIVSCPDDVTSADEADALANLMFKEPSIYDTKHIYCVTEDDLKAYKRKQDVRKALIKAVRNGSFDVYLQPIIDLNNDKVYSAEALVRLFDDEYGAIFPDEFIPVAEELGVISQVTSCVLTRVCRFMSTKKLTEKGVVRVHVNLSTSECIHGDSDGRLQTIIKENGLDTSNICFEVSESSAFGNGDPVSDGIRMLNSLGLGVLIDDYGTGYSNMSELISLPIDIVKIDKSLLWMAMEDEDAMIILHDIVRMIHKLGKEIQITGVENVEQLHIIRDIGVRYAQGYCYSEPVPMDDYLEYLTNVNEYGFDPIAQ